MLNTKVFLILILSLALSSSKMIIHILPHSHQDPGWIKTIDEYYKQQVEKIFDSIIKSLKENPQRTFNFEEIVFFKMWYESKNRETKKLVKKFLNEGRIVFLNGGWVMEDQGVSFYKDVIKQLRIGLEFLKNEFDYKPHIGWFSDQFGHSATHAYIYAKFGFDRFVVNRIYDRLRMDLYQKKDLELMWKPFEDKEVQIFTHFVNHPNDWFIPPDSIKDYVIDREYHFSESDLERISGRLINECRSQLRGFKHEHLTVYYGNDFAYTNGDTNYKNLEQIMEYINSHYSDQIEVKYSTIEKYFKEIEPILKGKNLRVYNGDFLPYVGDYSAIWTGYFTSRPYLKGKIYEDSILLSLTSRLAMEYYFQKTIHSSKIPNIQKDFYDAQTQLLESISVAQHHDAVSGTAKSYVSNDYISRLEKGETNVLIKTKEYFKDIFNENNVEICLSNGKIKYECEMKFTFDIKNYILNCYNPGIDSTMLVTLVTKYELKDIDFDILNYKDEEIEFDKYCIPDYKCYIFFFYDMNKKYSFIPFKITNLRKSDSSANSSKFSSIKNKNITIYSNDNNHLNKIDYNIEKNLLSFKFQNDLLYDLNIIHSMYSSSGGAYIFNTGSKEPTDYKIDNEKSYFFNKNKISSGILLRTPKSYLLITIFFQQSLIHTISRLDPVQRGSSTTEFILSVKSNLKNKNVFYTDTSGFKMQQRKLTGSYRTGEGYFPVTRDISIVDENDNKMISVYNDKPQGGSSTIEGNIYLIINRWSTSDDGKGVFENLFEEQSTDNEFEIKHLITLKTKNNEIDMINQKICYNYFNENLLIFNFNKRSFDDNLSKFKINNLLNEYFIVPQNIKLDVIFVGENRILLQLINLYDEFYESEISKSRRIISFLKNDFFDINVCDISGFECDSELIDDNHNLRRDYIHFILPPREIMVLELNLNKNDIY